MTTTDRLTVLAAEPTAFAHHHAERGWKVWYYVTAINNGGVDPLGYPGHNTRVALSASWETEAAAWRDACEAIARRAAG